MKFSRNPITGVLESYKDDGAYVGTISTFADMPEEQFTTDGGPGSGNYGHAGRPGQVGGSAPGGGYGSGKMYRHEKKGVGFFSTKKDWLNGLEGEKQHKAARFLASKKKEMKEALEKAEKFKKYHEAGLYTKEQYEENIKKLGANGLNEKSPVEEYIMKKGNEEDVKELLDHLEDARAWGQYKEKYAIQNLSEEERKVLRYLDEKNDWGKTFHDLQAKAMGIPNSGDPIPEETLYESGVKKRPEPEGPDYGWYEKKKDIYTDMGWDMSVAIGEKQYGKRNVEEFKILNKSFVNHMRYEKLTPIKTRYAIKAIHEMRDVFSAEKTPSGWYNKRFKQSIEPEMVNRLDDNEKDKLLRIANWAFDDGFNPVSKFDKIEDINDDDYDKIEDALENLNLRTTKDQNIVRDYVLIMEKMMTGEVPTEENPVEIRKKIEEEKKRAEAEAKAQRHKEFIERRDREQEEYRNSPAYERKKKILENLKNTTKEQIMSMDRMQVVDFGMSIMRENEPFVTVPEVPTEFYQATLLAMKDVMERFPFLAGELGGFGDITDNGMAGCSIYGGDAKANGRKDTEILINPKEFSDMAKLKALRERKVQEKWWVPSDPSLPEGYVDICHELGHVVAQWLNRYTSEDGTVVTIIPGDYFFKDKRTSSTAIAPMLKKNVLAKFGIKTTDYDTIKDELSEYGASSCNNRGTNQRKNNSPAEEFFAECFAEMMCNKTPRRVAAEFEIQLEEFIKKHNISEANSARTKSTAPKITEVRKGD